MLLMGATDSCLLNLNLLRMKRRCWHLLEMQMVLLTYGWHLLEMQMVLLTYAVADSC